VRRLKIGLLIPSTNTVAEPEVSRVLPDGVSVHTGRMLVTQPEVGSDEGYLYLNEQMMKALDPTLDNLLTCRPDHLALGMSSMSMAGGAEADRTLRARIEDSAGVPVSSGPSAILAALRAVGAERVALLSPFQPAVQREAVRYFEESGVEVVADYSFLAQSTIAIADIGPADIRAAIEATDSHRVEAVVQPGTNVPMAFDAAAAEWWLGKPVLHVNTVMAWDALRTHRIPDQVAGFGALLADH
jgi:maleate isomerase